MMIVSSTKKEHSSPSSPYLKNYGPKQKQFNHSYYKELARKPGKLQRNKQRSNDLCWKVHDPAQSFVLCSHTLAELRNRHVSIG